MNNDVYPFKLGAFECFAVSDGSLTYAPPRFPPPATLLFSNAPKDELENTLTNYDIQPAQWTEWKSPYISLLVKTQTHLVLVDTGADGLDENTGKIVQNLKANGISQESIDVIIHTHGHPDHIGGNTGDDGKLTFPNARYVMWKDEWDFWTTSQAKEQVDEHSSAILLAAANKNLPPISNRLDLVENEDEILLGIQAVKAPGHTPGHMALKITSEGEHLLCLGDTVLHPIHLEHPEWCAAVDFAPDQVVSTRKRLLNMAASENLLAIAFHFPFPGLGHIVEKGAVWQWQPINKENLL